MHYEERLENDLSQIDKRIAAIGERVEQSLQDAVQALLSGDHTLAYSVVLGDLAINRAINSITRRCHAFVALHLPSAGHLRRISSVMRLDVELERIGDYAASIAREAVQLSSLPPEDLGRSIDLMGGQTHSILHDAIKSFLDRDPELARTTKDAAYAVERTYQSMFNDLIDEGERGGRPIHDLFALLVVFNRLGRIADQSKNICEDTLFAVAGETKQPKVYKVLFVDETNDCASQVAEAIGRKAFPNSGDYDSAGWNPAETIHPALLRFMERNGHPIERIVSSSLVSTANELNDYHVIVSLGGDVRKHIPSAPFHTIFLTWDITSCAADLDGDNAERELADVYQEIAAEIKNLMTALRGEDAD